MTGYEDDMIKPIRELVQGIDPNAPAARDVDALLLVIVRQDDEESPRWQDEIFLINPQRKEAF